MKSGGIGFVAVAAMLAALANGCGPKPPSSAPGQLFTDITGQSGVDFQHRSGLDGSFRIAQIAGSGLAVFDADNDADLDIFLVNGESLPNRLFLQTAPGRFEDTTDSARLGDTGYGMGAAIGDIDNDGDLDLFVSNIGADRLYRNEGAGRFTDISEALADDPATWSTSAAMFDYDRDGDLDLYVASYVDENPPRQCRSQGGRPDFCGPSAYPGVADRLLRNDGGNFTDVSKQSGIADARGRGLGLVVHDFDGNGWPDVFVANDGEANNLWLNSGEGAFEDHAVRAGVAYNMFGKSEASMGVALGDTDGNGSLDLFVTHLSTETNTLYSAGGAGNMLDQTAASGLGAASLPYTGFGTAMFDLELDGDLDIAIANGRVSLSPEYEKSAVSDQDEADEVAYYVAGYGEPDQVFVNDGGGRFDPGCPNAGPFCSEPSVARGLLAIDIDSDGDLDLLMTRSNGSARIYRNDAPRAGDWLTVRVLDRSGTHDAIGATVELSGARSTQIRLVQHSSSYLSSADARVHFGIPPQYAVTGMTVTWPDGERERFEVDGLNRQLTVRQGSGASIQ
jgi:hypothetical protein